MGYRRPPWRQPRVFAGKPYGMSGRTNQSQHRKGTQAGAFFYLPKRTFANLRNEVQRP